MPSQERMLEAPETATPVTELTGRVAGPAAPDPSRYREFARPETGRLLRALGLDVTYLRAEGDRMVYEHRGERREVTDLMGGYGANLFGHHHPALVAALRQALDDRAPVQAQASCRAWAGELAAALSRRIGESTGRDYVVTFANTGAEAIEAGLKHAELERYAQAESAARRYRRRMNVLMADAGADQAAFIREVGRELGIEAPEDAREALLAIARANDEARRQPPVYFALERAFHGKTTGASQLTYHPAYREPFGRVGVKCEFLPAGEPEAWRRAIARATSRTWEVACRDGRLELAEKPWVNVSAILVEPIQGEGGIHPLSPEDAAAIRALADAHGIPVIVDEIQTGLGRTGAFLASSACGLVGDYYAFAKSLGGGLTKTAALALDQGRYQADFGLVHTSTFAEDDLSSRVALRALALLDEEDVPGRCDRLGAAFFEKVGAVVAKHPLVLEPLRGRGLMLGLAFKPQTESASNAIRMLSDHGYLGYAIAGYMLHEEGFRVAPTLSASVIRLEPSAFLDPLEIDRFCLALDRLSTILERGNAYRLCRYVVGLADPVDPSPVRDYRDHAPRTRREKPACEKRVAFVGHFIQAKDALLWDPSLAELPEGAIESFQLATHRIFGPTIYDQIHVKSAIGETVHLSMIGVHLTSKAIEQAMRDRDTDWIVELVEEAVAKAREAGCQVVGLGGYTSIVTDNGRRIGEGGVAITTGNSLTVAMGLEALTTG
ncbi:MAG: aminotransferase class III-fold pyridoxal phosphate-dependent enzyme, partial [Candidatus Sericytochromatia bacterium]